MHTEKLAVKRIQALEYRVIELTDLLQLHKTSLITSQQQYDQEIVVWKQQCTELSQQLKVTREEVIQGRRTNTNELFTVLISILSYRSIYILIGCICFLFNYLYHIIHSAQQQQVPAECEINKRR